MLDLFSGIGGFSLAAQWVWEDELEIVAFCEIDKFCQKVLRKYWPDVPIIEDVRDVKGNKWTGKIDVLTGGFPCQSFSRAGKRRGTEDKRYLWPEMLRIIREVRPGWVIGENVISASNLVRKEWKTDLENLEYEVRTFDIPASACGLSTMERHLWIIAATTSQRFKGIIGKKIPDIQISKGKFPRSNQGDIGRWSVPSSRVCRMGERIPNLMDRLKSLGNAIVPQVAYQIFKAIKEIEMNICPHNGPKMTHSNSEVECLSCHEIIGKGREG